MLETEIKCRSDASPSGNCPIKSGKGGASSGQLPHISSSVFATCAGLSVPVALDWAHTAVICGSKRSIECASQKVGPGKEPRWQLARLCLFRDFFLGSGENSPFVPGQTLETFAGNLVEDRIDFFGDKLIGSHRTVAVYFGAALPQGALQNRGSAETE